MCFHQRQQQHYLSLLSDIDDKHFRHREHSVLTAITWTFSMGLCFQLTDPPLVSKKRQVVCEKEECQILNIHKYPSKTYRVLSRHACSRQVRVKRETLLKLTPVDLVSIFSSCLLSCISIKIFTLTRIGKTISLCLSKVVKAWNCFHSSERKYINLHCFLLSDEFELQKREKPTPAL